jgi:hypothetical protein
MQLKILFLLFLSSNLFSQNKCDKTLVTGRVIDTLNNQQFYNLMIVNKSTGRGVFGLPDGTFNVYAKQGDSIVLSVKNYTSLRFIVQPDSVCQMKNNYFVIGKTQNLSEVVIKPLKSIQQIKEERLNLSMRETKTTSGVDAFNSPVTFLYERFSQKAQAKQKVAEMKHEDNKKKILKELLHVYAVYEIIELSDDQFDDFISFLNISEDFLKTSTDLELIIYIKDKLEHFKYEMNLNK